jgi:hypothetical protein
MRFKPGDATDSEHCVALHHEFLRCQVAFEEFKNYGTTMITAAAARAASAELQTPADPLLAFSTYNAYARFIHHLYEFLIGGTQRDIGNSQTIRAEDAERYIRADLQRFLNKTRKAIQNGTAPAWENHISYYPETVPPDFAREFREYRNKVSGHVTHQRSSLSLSEFYQRNHKYLYMLYRDSLQHWGLRTDGFPDLKEITEFTVLVEKNTPP